MKLKLLDHIVCPHCGCSLTLFADKQISTHEVDVGKLKCSHCGIEYPIIDGIPRFVPASNYADSFGFQWNLFSQTQKDEYWGANISQERFQQETRWPERLESELILEAGCGMGRFTPYAAATGAEVISLDYSRAVDAAQRNNAGLANVHFIQADIYHLPFKRESFNRVFCFGVLQHCPDPRAAFLSLIPFLRPEGSIVVDVYKKSWRNIFFGYYYLRVFTKGRNPSMLFPWVKNYFEVVYALTGFVRLLNARVSGWLSMLLGIADYRGVFNISEERMKELCLLDTFDRLSPAHDHPQTLRSVRNWCEDGSLVGVDVKYGYNGIEAHGRTPGGPSS